MAAVLSYPINASDAVSHFFSVIDLDGRHLSDVVAKYTSSGNFFVLAPPGVSYNRLLQFRIGGLALPPSETDFSSLGDASDGRESVAAVRATDLVGAMTAIVCQRVKRVGATVFIREPYLRYDDESAIVGELTNVGASLYKVMPSDRVNMRSLAQNIMKFQVSWSFLLILSRSDDRERSIENIVGRADVISVNSYDGESFLYWMRTDA